MPKKHIDPPVITGETDFILVPQARVFRIRAGDVLPQLAGRAVTRVDGYPLPLDDAAAIFFMWEWDSIGSPVASGAARVAADDEEINLSYMWLPGDTMQPGNYHGAFELVYPGDYRVTVPGGQRHIPIVITQDGG